MIYFLTSSPYGEDQVSFVKQSDFVETLKKFWSKPCNVLYIASFPDTFDITDQYAKRHEGIYREAGFQVENWTVLDYRNSKNVHELIKNAGVIILSGGHCMTEAKFFEELNLREGLKGFDGIIIGVSAGSMNSAETVYAPEEYEEELSDKNFVRFYPGLGLTKTNIFPHYQIYKDEVFGGKRMIEDIVCHDSIGHKFYVFCDGSYVLGDGVTETIHGPYIIIEDGKISEEKCDIAF